MVRTLTLCMLFAVVFQLQAQSIALTGKVTDQNAKAINGAIVTLKSKNLSDTTDASGSYSLTGVISAVNHSAQPAGKDAIFLKNGLVRVQLVQTSPVVIELFDMSGKLVDRISQNNVSAGNYTFELNKNIHTTNMMMVRVTIGRHTESFCFTPFNLRLSSFTNKILSSNNSRLAKTLVTGDTLQATALGYKTKKIPIASYSETVDITLEAEFTGTCTQSKTVNMTVSGSGPHKVVVETNSDPGIKEGTIYRPQDLGPGKNYPIFIWGEGACSLDGKSNSAAMAQIASHGYFVIADGTPGGSGGRAMDFAQIIKPARAYVTWAIAENRKPCSAYYQSLDTTKIAGNGFSCGGFFGQALAGDPRTATWGVSSSGSFGNNPDLWNSVHTPVLILEGSKDVSNLGGTGAYTNGLRDYNGIAPLKWPIMFFSNKNMGHGGDLWAANGGDFTKINLAWLNWWLKGDTGATGKGVLVGPACKYCTDNNWEVKSANIQ